MGEATAPDLTLSGTTGPLRLRPAPGKRLLVVFYQEDSTPACSTQVTSFKDEFALLQELGAEVVAISSDTLASHHAFVERLHGLPFALLSDPEGEAARAFGVWDADIRRARRAVFVLDERGMILYTAPHYNPANLADYERIFQALGLDDAPPAPACRMDTLPWPRRQRPV